MYIVIGLGNPGAEYANTRHNTGKITLAYIEENISPKLSKAVKFLHQDTFMNKTGPAVAKAMAGKSSEKLIVIYDDIDLPLGTMRLSYNRGSGGHKGLESIIRAIKTKEFIRIRIGIVPTTPTGKLKKPKTENEVEKFILSNFKSAELSELKKTMKRALKAVETLIEHGLARAMTEGN